MPQHDLDPLTQAAPPETAIGESAQRVMGDAASALTVLLAALWRPPRVVPGPGGRAGDRGPACAAHRPEPGTTCTSGWRPWPPVATSTTTLAPARSASRPPTSPRSLSTAHRPRSAASCSGRSAPQGPGSVRARRGRRAEPQRRRPRRYAVRTLRPRPGLRRPARRGRTRSGLGSRAAGTASARHTPRPRAGRQRHALRQPGPVVNLTERARCALGLHRLGVRAGFHDPATTALLDEAASALPKSALAWRAQVLAAIVRHRHHHRLQQDAFGTELAERAPPWLEPTATRVSLPPACLPRTMPPGALPAPPGCPSRGDAPCGAAGWRRGAGGTGRPAARGDPAGVRRPRGRGITQYVRHR